MLQGISLTYQPLLKLVTRRWAPIPLFQCDSLHEILFRDAMLDGTWHMLLATLNWHFMTGKLTLPAGAPTRFSYWANMCGIWD